MHVATWSWRNDPLTLVSSGVTSHISYEYGHRRARKFCSCLQWRHMNKNKGARQGGKETFVFFRLRRVSWWFYWAVWKQRPLRGPLWALLRPSVYAFMFVRLLRRDVKVCGSKRWGSGMNASTFWDVFKRTGVVITPSASLPLGHAWADRYHASADELPYWKSAMARFHASIVGG